VTLGKDFYRLPAFSGEAPILIGGAVLQPQSLWVIGALVVVVAALKWFFDHTRLGKAILATSHNRLAAQLVGIEVRTILLVSFGLSAALGAIAGILTAPITLTKYDVGIMLGLKGFAAAILGGLGSSYGAVAGGIVLGIVEAMSAGYISSAYKDAVAFVIILGVLFFMPSGLFGTKRTERV
jgi:branched-chain amino acid transport system permease protein